MNNNNKLSPLKFKYIYLFFLTIISIFCTTLVVAINDYPSFTKNSFRDKSILFTQFNNALAVNILDLNSSIEIKVLQKYDNLDKKSITPMFYDESLSIYYIEINPDDSQSGIAVSKKTFLIVFFIKQLFVDANEVTIQIAKEVYSTWFSTFYNIEMYDRNNNQTLTGMAPFLNTQNLKLSDSSNLRNSLLELALGVSRQIMLLSSLDHQNIPHILQQKAKVTRTIFQTPCSTFIKYFTIDNNNPDTTIKDVLQQMHDIINAVEYLHENKIAHGDIELLNLFIKDNKIVLSGLERFSMFSNDKEQVLGIKKFNFPTKISYAPEFHHPLDNNKSLLTHASFKGDIWSLGLVLATILHSYYQGCFDINKLTIKDKIDDYLYQQEYISSFFKVMPAKDNNIIPKIAFGTFWYIISSLNKLVGSIRPKENNFQQKIEALIEIINSCHVLSPEARPTATEIKNKLSELIH